MRRTSTLILGLLAVLLMTSTAKADAPHVFGTTNCQQKFTCSSTPAQVTQIANGCAVQGLGISQQTGLFDGMTLDSGNCMVSNLPNPNNGTRPSGIECCVTTTSDSCSMRCQLLMY